VQLSSGQNASSSSSSSSSRRAAGSPAVSSPSPLGAATASAAALDPLAALLAGRSSPVRSRVLTASVDQQLKWQQQRLRMSGGLDAAAGGGMVGAGMGARGAGEVRGIAAPSRIQVIPCIQRWDLSRRVQRDCWQDAS
jgi:hypothetical protein